MMKKLTQRGLPFRNQWKMGILVVGLLAIFFFGGGKVDATFTEVFSDDFKRADTTNADLGSGRVQPKGTSRTIQNTTAVVAGGTSGQWNNELLRPTSENMENGKIRVIVDNPIKVLSSIQIAYSAVGRRQPNRSAYYIGYFYCVNNLLTSKLKVISNGVVPNGGGTEIGTSIVNTLPCPAGSITAELEIVSLNSTTSQLTWTLYNSGNVAFAVVSGTDTTLSLQTTGQWGTWGFGVPQINGITLWEVTDEPILLANSLIPEKTLIKIGTPITFNITSSGNQTISLSSNAGGILSTTNVILNTGNGRTDTFTYTPTQAGTGTIIANFSDGTVLTGQIFASSYSTTIGFIGDSITEGVCGTTNCNAINAVKVAGNILKTNVVNRGVGNTDTKDRKENHNHGGTTPIMTDALSVFNSSGIEIVHIMLGANDAEIGAKYATGTYKANLEAIIATLTGAGIPKVILSYPTYVILHTNNTIRDQESLDLLIAYQSVIDELIDNTTVYLGDTLAFDYFSGHQSEIGNGSNDFVHPNQTGYQSLGAFRAEAISSAIRTMETPPMPIQLTITGTMVSDSKIYDGTTTATIISIGTLSGIIAGDSVNVNATANYDTPNIGNNKQITVIYTISGADAGKYLAPTIDSSFIGAIINSPIPTPTPTSPSSSGGGGGGGSSLSKDTCPNGDFSSSYYDKTCGTTADLKAEVAKKVNLLRPLIVRIYLTAMQEQKTLVHELISSCSVKNKREVIKLACQELIGNRDF